MSGPTAEQLLALADEWDREAAEEIADDPYPEHSREGLAAGVLSKCAQELRELVTRISRESAR